jgi:hypothetical protein
MKRDRIELCLGQFMKKSTDSLLYLSRLMEHILSVDIKIFIPLEKSHSFRRCIAAPSSL